MTGLIIFVGQGMHKINYKNTFKAKLYKAYSIFNKHSFCHATSNKKVGFVMLRHARFPLIDLKSNRDWSTFIPLICITKSL
ncbi:hypothetical protein A7P53_16655 [Acinetobacter defluvii]|nr:hypothetical protein [Acinetobacter defluvii]